MPKEITRIFIKNPVLNINQEVELDNHSHYIINVMRLKEGDELIVFNGLDGDWFSKIIKIKNRRVVALLMHQVKKQDITSNRISLAFCLPKKQILTDIAKQATELGVSKFYPLVSKRSFMANFNQQNFLTNVIEACQQSKNNNIPKVGKKSSFVEFIKNINYQNSNIIFCDESDGGKKAKEAFNNLDFSKENIIIIGPEGGFSEEEFSLIEDKDIIRLDLGPNILRVATACVAAISVVNVFCDNG